MKIKKVSEYKGVIENPSECSAIKQGRLMVIDGITYSISAISNFNNLTDGSVVNPEDITFSLLKNCKGKVVPLVL